MIKIAKAYRIKTSTAKNHRELEFEIYETLSYPEAILCEMKLDLEEKNVSKAILSKKQGGRICIKAIRRYVSFFRQGSIQEEYGNKSFRIKKTVKYSVDL
ncbi:unnamed protein product [marine sediment metagenome]|uniref:Uncharacterized protein n=1 Tax=marine sediment metagenome TaxID=412755 RepID=X1HV44_9ZZZZ